jgi:sirohydrochlorin ferrochelatase
VTLGVLLAHGSPDPRSARWVACAAAGAGDRAGFPVVTAFLDHDQPSLEAAVATSDDDDVVVLPLLLSSAFHARVDVPAAVDALPRPVRLLPPLGHPAAVLDTVLSRAGGAAVVVAAGTKVDEERAAFADAVAASAERVGVPASVAFATGPGSRLTESAPGTAVVPWLLAPGRLLDAVVTEAQEAGLTLVGGPLLDEATMLDAIAAALTVREAG